MTISRLERELEVVLRPVDLEVNPALSNSPAWTELLTFIRGREGVYNHFYCDHLGKVTIGIGILVDTMSQTIASNLLSPARGLRFQKYPGGETVTNPQDIIDDWNRVKRAYDSGRKPAARSYASISKIRLDQDSVVKLFHEYLQGRIRTFQARKPFFNMLPPYIQIAILDTRFNPCQVSVFGREFEPVWNNLNPANSSRNLQVALDTFSRLWTNKCSQNTRYQGRVRKRIEWFARGIGQNVVHAIPSIPVNIIAQSRNTERTQTLSVTQTPNEIIARAKSTMGKNIKYEWNKGGRYPDDPLPTRNFLCDCSGFVCWVFKVSRATRNPFYIWNAGTRNQSAAIYTLSMIADILAVDQGLFDQLTTPEVGCIVVYAKAGTKERHVGIVSEITGNRITKVIHCSSTNSRRGDAIQETTPAAFVLPNGSLKPGRYLGRFRGGEIV